MSIPTTIRMSWPSSGAVRRIGVAGTRLYGAGLTRDLRGSGIDLVEVHRPHRQCWRQRGKSKTTCPSDRVKPSCGVSLCGFGAFNQRANSRSHMSLKHVKQTFEVAGREDPLYAVFTDHARKGGKWDHDEFFAHGRNEIESVLQYVRSSVSAIPMNNALDFGCGVGRLTQALGDHFDRVVGVDISSSMVEAANRYNRKGNRVRYVVNDTPHLRAFSDSLFKFIYSNITLQHVPPEPALAYVSEFVRLLCPGGVAVFQMGIGAHVKPGTLSALLYRFRREYVRRFWKRVRGRIPYEMHFVSRQQVTEAVEQAGGRIVDVVDVSKLKNGGSLRFAVMRPAE